MYCWCCKTDDRDEFILHHNRVLCDDCLAIFNYHYRELFKEIKGEARTCDIDEATFIEALTEFVDSKGNEYNESLRKERRNDNNI